MMASQAGFSPVDGGVWKPIWLMEDGVAETVVREIVC